MVLEAIAHVEVAKHLRVSAVVGDSAGPHAGTEHRKALGHISSHCPHIFCVASVGRRVQEVSAEDVLVASAKRLLFVGLDWAQVHVAAQVTNFLHHHSLEGFVQINLVQRVLLVRAHRHNCALVVNLTDHQRKAVELSNGPTFVVANNIGVQTREKCVMVFQSGGQIPAGSGQLGESVMSISAPEESLLRELAMAAAVAAHSDEIV